MKYITIICIFILTWSKQASSVNPVTLCECPSETTVFPSNNRSYQQKLTITFASKDSSCSGNGLGKSASATYNPYRSDTSWGQHNGIVFRKENCNKRIIVGKNYFDQEISKLKDQNDKDRKLILNLTKLLQNQIDDIKDKNNENK